jgi:glycosyltransferase involved in cell wall biosynthesis
MAVESLVGAESAPAKTEAPVWPRISLITPVRNSGKYIEQTIRSVLIQDYPNLEYFIVDGGSTDNTVDIIRKYEAQISGWVSEPDKGMYDALNKGFARTSGTIMGWISATDQLHIGGLHVVGSIFRDLPTVQWITGRPTTFNEAGMTVGVFHLLRWSRYRFLAGANRYIQQESTFWRRSLWEKAGGRVDDSRRMASDFELWVRFFRYAQLYPVDALIGGFRVHAVSLGVQEVAECDRIQQEIVDAELERSGGLRSLRWLRGVNRAVQHIPKIRNWWQRFVILNLHRGLYWVPGPDLPPIIQYERDIWGFRRTQRPKPDLSSGARHAK